MSNQGDDIRDSICSAIERRRTVLVNEIAKTIYEELSHKIEHSSFESDWIPIESLSKLRQVVGGRFQNIKLKWLAAGFPLRAHRGDRQEEASLNEAGWLELSKWIYNQGYDVKLGVDSSEKLFEVKKRDLG